MYVIIVLIIIITVIGIIDTSLIKILWNFNIYCDQILITIIDKTAKVVTLVDISIPADKIIDEIEDDKISK